MPMTTTNTTPSSPFLDLPTELRNIIYAYVLAGDDTPVSAFLPQTALEHDPARPPNELSSEYEDLRNRGLLRHRSALLHTCSQIASEAWQWFFCNRAFDVRALCETSSCDEDRFLLWDPNDHFPPALLTAFTTSLLPGRLAQIRHMLVDVCDAHFLFAQEWKYWHRCQALDCKDDPEAERSTLMVSEDGQRNSHMDYLHRLHDARALLTGLTILTIHTDSLLMPYVEPMMFENDRQQCMASQFPRLVGVRVMSHMRGSKYVRVDGRWKFAYSDVDVGPTSDWPSKWRSHI